jgi:hypothetical protein
VVEQHVRQCCRIRKQRVPGVLAESGLQRSESGVSRSEERHRAEVRVGELVVKTGDARSSQQRGEAAVCGCDLGDRLALFLGLGNEHGVDDVDDTVAGLIVSLNDEADTVDADLKRITVSTISISISWPASSVGTDTGPSSARASTSAADTSPSTR